MTPLIVLIVAVIIGGTWLDWQEVERQSRSPEWINGIAMAGMLTACLTTCTLISPLFEWHTTGQAARRAHSPVPWTVLAIATCAFGLAAAALHRRRAHTVLFLTGLLLASLCLGFWMTS